MNIRLERVIQEIRDERLRQDVRWGGPEHDDAQPMRHLLEFIRRELVERAIADLDVEDYRDIRRCLIQVAALAIAGVESLDRRA